MASNQEIPREQWDQFFKDFSSEHEGEPVSIELMGMDLGDQPLTESTPLVGISCDTKGSRQGAIEIMAGENPSSVMTHVIDHPTHVRVAMSGPEQSVEIEAEGEPTALIRILQSKGLQA
jgi:hypothetical protein